MAKFIKLDQKKRTVTIREALVDHPLVFNFFNNQNEDVRDAVFTRALSIGVLALMEDRLSAFLAKTANTLGTELESLKYMFDLNQELFLRTTGKGRDAEHYLAEVLEEFLRARGYKDVVSHAGEQFGKLPKNKSGDLVIDVKGSPPRRIVIESKFDKAKRLGLISERDILAKADTAVSQLLESVVNRDADAAIIVFDREIVDAKLLEEVGSARYIPACGYVCIVESSKGEFTNLFLCYELARTAVLIDRSASQESLAVLTVLIGRFLQDFSVFDAVRRRVKQSVEDQLELLALIEKALLSIEFSKEMFSRFLENGNLTRADILNFYQATEVRARFQELEKDIEKIGK